MTIAQAESCAALTVRYDGACPLCRREVGVYPDLKPLRPLQWLDVSAPHAELLDGRLVQNLRWWASAHSAPFVFCALR